MVSIKKNTPYDKTEQSLSSCINKRLQNLIHQNWKESLENTNTHIKHTQFFFFITNTVTQMNSEFLCVQQDAG